MQSIINYLQSNQLNPIAIYDFQAQSSYSLNSSTLSITNLIANELTLTSNITTEHPVRKKLGLYFTDAKYLYLLNTNILNSSNEYSILFLTVSSKLGSLLEFDNTSSSNSYPNIKYFIDANNKFNQNTKSNNLITSLAIDNNYDISELNFNVINHNVKYGLTSYSKISNTNEDSSLDNFINFSKSSLTSSNQLLDKLTIGSLNADFILNKLIICDKQLNLNQINEIVDKLKIVYYSYNIEAITNNKLAVQGYSLNKLEVIFNIGVGNLIWNLINRTDWNDVNRNEWDEIIRN